MCYTMKVQLFRFANVYVFVQVDIGDGVKPAGYYVQRSCGLFPAPRPQTNSDQLHHVESLYNVMGVFFAKCIQDQRLIDLPLSKPFLKLMCLGDVLANVSNTQQIVLNDSMSILSGVRTTQDLVTPTRESPVIHDDTLPWYSGVLMYEDFEIIDPHRARFLKQLKDLVARKQALCDDKTLSDQERETKIAELTLENPPVKLEDLR